MIIWKWPEGSITTQPCVGKQSGYTLTLLDPVRPSITPEINNYIY